MRGWAARNSARRCGQARGSGASPEHGLFPTAPPSAHLQGHSLSAGLCGAGGPFLCFSKHTSGACFVCGCALGAGAWRGPACSPGSWAHDLLGEDWAGQGRGRARAESRKALDSRASPVLV